MLPHNHLSKHPMKVTTRTERLVVLNSHHWFFDYVQLHSLLLESDYNLLDR